jgi:hypothetical protein
MYDKVKWEFVQEVMCRKGFLEKWIKQTMATIQGVKYVLMLMGERTPFFRTYQGLGQGGSPFSNSV